MCSLSLLERLTKLWTAYEKEMDTSVSDFLSLHHLGTVLNHLAHLGMYETVESDTVSWLHSVSVSIFTYCSFAFCIHDAYWLNLPHDT